MNLNVSKEAAQWYKSEMHLEEGDSIKFFGKVYGKNGFSIALAKMEPTKSLLEVTVEGITFYVEKTDSWFFEDTDLKVTLDPDLKEPNYDFVKR